VGYSLYLNRTYYKILRWKGIQVFEAVKIEMKVPYFEMRDDMYIYYAQVVHILEQGKQGLYIKPG
jgi:hypothetical protein